MTSKNKRRLQTWDMNAHCSEQNLKLDMLTKLETSRIYTYKSKKKDKGKGRRFWFGGGEAFIQLLAALAVLR